MVPFWHYLLTSFLSNDTQILSVNNYSSNSITLKSGVPQGSVLSPLLFNLYVNDLSSVINRCYTYQYADDTIILATDSVHQNAIETLWTDTISVMDWFHNNLLSINESKIKLGCFWSLHKKVDETTSCILHNLRCSNCCCTKIPYLRTIKYLGLTFDHHMTWNSLICNKLHGTSCILYNLR